MGAPSLWLDLLGFTVSAKRQGTPQDPHSAKRWVQGQAGWVNMVNRKA